TVIDRLETLTDLEQTWGRLLAETRDGGFARSLGCFRAFAAHDPGVIGIRCLVVEHGGEPVGIVPLVLSRGRGNGRAVTLGWGPHGFGLAGGPVGRDQAASLMTAVRHLSTARRDWDILELDEPPTADGATSSRRADVALRLTKMKFDTVERTPVASLSTETRWVDVVGAAETETRLAFFRSLHYAEQGGHAAGLTFDHTRASAFSAIGSDLTDEAMGLVVAERQRPLLTAIVDAAMADGHDLDLAILRREGRPIAAHVGLKEGDTLRSLGGMADAAADEADRLEFVRRLVEAARDRGDTSMTWPWRPTHPCHGWEQRLRPSIARRHYAPLNARAQMRRFADKAGHIFGGSNRSAAVPKLQVVG
ncbi:MAG: GNAT family N-acetyltransferase, partial [Planctomycetota bacterium]